MENNSSNQNMNGSIEMIDEQIHQIKINSNSEIEIEPPMPQKHLKDQRLIIRKIDLFNFKSYYGKTTIGPFHKNFTSVVGPNGSGKSNLIECLLFIFGKKASKMRLNKLQQLIHNSGEHQNLSKASVTVTFEEIIDLNDNDYEVVPNTEFELRRTVYQNSSSKYEVNGHETSQADVITLLKQKGIDLDNNRFLILQGEVEQISTMVAKSNNEEKPGLLEYLEEIIGSNVFKQIIEDLEKSYEESLNIKLEKGELLRISEADLMILEEQKELACKFVKMEKQVYQLKSLISQIDRHKSNQILIKNEEEHERLIKEFKEQQIEIEKVKKENASVLKQYEECNNLIEKVNNKMIRLDKEVKDYELKDETLKQELQYLVSDEVKTKENLKNLLKQYQKKIEEGDELNSKKPAKVDELKSLTEMKTKEEKIFRDMEFNLKSKTEKLEKQKFEIQKIIAPIENKIQQLQGQKNIIEVEIQQYDNQQQDYQKTIEELQQRQVSTRTRISEITELHKSLNLCRNNLLESKAQQEDIMKQIIQQENKLKNDIYEMKNSYHEMNQDQRQFQSKNELVQRLMDAQNKGDLQGICGRLGDLGAINEQYDVAITKACGLLNHIVVEKLQDGQKCIEYLRSQRLGQASFIALDKIQEWGQKSNNNFQAPPNSKRLFDLIQISDNKYIPAFYFAIKDTLVCRDIDTATQISYGQNRMRCVTIDGVLIDISGAMSGGGQVRRGGMGNRVIKQSGDNSQQKLQELQMSIIKSEQLLNEVMSDRQVVQAKLQELQRDHVDLNMEQNKYRIEEDFLKDQMIGHQNDIEEFQKQLQRRNMSQEEKNSQTMKIKQFEKNIQEEQIKIQKYIEQLQIIDKQIEEIGGQEMLNQKNKFLEIEKLFKNCEKEYTQLEAQLQNIKKIVRKNLKEQEDEQKKIDQIEINIQKAHQKELEFEEIVVKILQEIQQSKEQKDKLEKQFANNQENRTLFEKIIQDIKIKMEDIKIKVKVAQELLKKATDEYNKANKNLKADRQQYQEIIAGYDFINIFEQVSGLSISGQPKNNDTLDSMNQSMIDISFLQQTDDNSLSHPDDRRRIKTALDLNKIDLIDIFQDLTQEKLEEITSLRTQIDTKLVFDQERLKTLNPQLNSIKEYLTKFQDHKSKEQIYNNAIKDINNIRVEVEIKRKKRLDLFMNGFNFISQHLKETYQLLTNGGDAELELIDSLDPFSEGVVFSVRPPKKSWKQMLKLSGGEKTLSSLALVFALHYFKPTPLYFMDEIDAALDFKNVAIIGKYIKERTKNAQFIIISLRHHMFELADTLVGIYKTHDCTKSIAINPFQIQMASNPKQAEDSQQ